MKQVSQWRTGVCSQHYHVNRLQTKGGVWIDLRKLDAQLFPMDKRTAFLVVSKHENVLAGQVRLTDLFGANSWLLNAIEYVVTACDGKKLVTEDFRHPFKEPTLITQPGFSWPWYLTGGKSALFTTRLLNDMFRSTAFGAVRGIQFCC